MAKSQATDQRAVNSVASRRDVSEPGGVIRVQRVTGSPQQQESVSRALQQGHRGPTISGRNGRS